MKKQNGITLIALIITIVVLLILAVVAINAVKDGGIITHAQNAANDYTIAQEKEQIALAYSEYFINKRTNPNATLEVEGATVTGSEENGWKLTFNKTNNAYEVDKDGNITYVEAEEDDTDVIAAEKDLMKVYYIYNTMYNLNQPEIVPAAGFYHDQDNNKICDYNPSLGAYIYHSIFNISKDFFAGTTLTPGDIAATITYLDGEEKNITLKTTDNKVWKYSEEGTTGLDDPTDIEIECRPYTKSYGTYAGAYQYDQDTHVLYIGGSVCVPIQKLSILGKTIEFPFNCQALLIGGDIDTQAQIPMYTNINNVSKITVNFSNGTNKVYTKDDFFNASSYGNGISKYYSSQDVPVLYDAEKVDGVILVNMPDSSLKVQIQSIIIEEEGVSTKFNIVEGVTDVKHISSGS